MTGGEPVRGRLILLSCGNEASSAGWLLLPIGHRGRVEGMDKIRSWYKGLSGSGKALVAVAVVVVIIAIVGSIGFMILNPKKVQVRYGTIVRDPVDGHVWEDKTKTAYVNPSQAGNYRVEYIDKLSPEHEQQQQQQQEQKAQQQQTPPIETLGNTLSSKQVQDIETLQSNVKTMGGEVVQGLKMASQINDTKASLVSYRNQIAALQLPAELVPKQQQIVSAFDMYIQACDLYLQGIANSDLSAIQQANSLIDQATQTIRSLIPAGV
jgi:hypothetical protein